MKNKKTVLIIVLSTVALIVVGVVGWGFYNGNRISTYVDSAQAMMNESDDWEDKYDNSYSSDLDDFSQVVVDLESIKKEADTNLATLNSANVPNKATDLHNYLVEYYTLASTMTGDIVTEVKKMEEEYGSFEEYMSKMDSVLDNELTEEEMENMTLKEFDEAMSDMEEDLTELDDELAKLDDDSFFGDMKTFEEIEKNVGKMEELEKKINLEALALKDTLFSLN